MQTKQLAEVVSAAASCPVAAGAHSRRGAGTGPGIVTVPGSRSGSGARWTGPAGRVKCRRGAAEALTATSPGWPVRRAVPPRRGWEVFSSLDATRRWRAAAATTACSRPTGSGRGWRGAGSFGSPRSTRRRPETVAKLAAAVFGFVDNLAAVSAAGFAERPRFRRAAPAPAGPAATAATATTGRPGAAIAELADQPRLGTPSRGVPGRRGRLGRPGRPATGGAWPGVRPARTRSAAGCPAAACYTRRGPITDALRAGLAAASVKAPLTVGFSMQPGAGADVAALGANWPAVCVAARVLLEPGPCSATSA